MVAMKTEVMLPGDRMRARIKRVRDVVKVPGVRVEPADGDGFKAEEMRRLLKHPSAGGFRSEGSIEWPNDTFTKRRLREGSIKLVGEKKEESDNGSRHSSPST